jgi:hypothetical protein
VESPSATRPLRPELRTADLPVKGVRTSCPPFGPLRSVNKFGPDPLTASLLRRCCGARAVAASTATPPHRA